MACKVMTELIDGATTAGKLMKSSKRDQHVVMMYAQWKLDAERMQRVHAELCQCCIEDISLAERLRA
jgi:hypothetical protein